MRFSTSFAALLAVVMAASSANGQIPTGLIGGLSGGCLGGLASLLGNSELNTCLGITSVVGTLGALQQNDSLVPAVNTYLTGSLCPAPVCSNSTLSQANSTISSACQSDISGNTSFLPSLLQLVLSQYRAVKTASCFTDNNANNQVCVTQTLTNLQQGLRTNLSLSEISTLASSQGGFTSQLGRLAQNATAFCTDCNKGILITLTPALQGYLNASTLQSLQGAVTQGCGQTFLTSGIPSTLKQTANFGNSTSSGGSGSGSSSGSSGSNGGAALSASLLTVSSGLLAVGLALVAA